MKREWTPEQRAAIVGTGNLLVSAAAGSGKTSVLAERCVHLVCDEKHKANVTQLLVVTFTEAAAAEMRGRIEQALRGRLRGSPEDAHLIRQVALVEDAPISTLHGFCSRLLRQYFHKVGLDPAFRVLDEDEATLLRLETIRALFTERYDTDGSREFHRFVDQYGEGNDQPLMQRVIAVHDLLWSLVDPREWTTEALRRIEEGAEARIEDSVLGREFLEKLAEDLADLRRDCELAVARMVKMPGFGAYVKYLNFLGDTAGGWKDVLDLRGYDALVNLARGWAAPPLPRMATDAPGREVARGLMDRIKKRFCEGPVMGALRFSSEEWREGLRLALPHARVFVELVRAFAQRYRKEKRALGALDFSDLERHTLDLLREPKAKGLAPSGVARQLRKRYRHVLVDEYQDINEVQDAILALVSRESRGGGDEGNLFCVGDVKQSIYGFRLAEPARFLARNDRFRRDPSIGRVIDLQANFRSRGPLLGVLNRVFGLIMTRQTADIDYDASQELKPAAAFAAADGVAAFTGAPVELHLLPEKLGGGGGGGHGEDDGADVELERNEREGMLLARRIRQMMGLDGGEHVHVSQRLPDGSLSTRPLKYRDVVVLLRSMRFHADQYATILRRHGIPVFNAGGAGYFDSMEVRDVMALLRVLDNQRQDVALATALRSPMSAVARPDEALARIRLAYPPAAVPFHEAVERYAREKEDEVAVGVRAFLGELERWRQMTHQRPVAEVVWDVYERTGYLAFCSGLENGSQRVANLVELYDRARQFGSFSRQGLYRFNRFLENLRLETDPAQAAELSEAEDVVRIISVHRSKGLEFPVVFLPGMGKKINMQSCSGRIIADRHAFLGLDAVDERRRVRYPSLASVLVSRRLRRQNLAEEMRVLYVAATRAKEHLVLIGTCREDRADAWDRDFADHSGGPLPAAAVLSANCMLDWLGPASAVLAARDGGESIRVFPHPVEAVTEWTKGMPTGKERAAVSSALARLDPIDPPPGRDELAGAVVERLTRRYEREPFTTVRAAVAATEIGKRTSLGSRLREPRCVAGETVRAAADRGSAVHLFLEHLDFARAGSADELRGQLEDAVDRKRMTPAQADGVDLGLVRWFLDTDLGRRLRRNADALLRELPVTTTRPPESFVGASSDDPLDRVMVRGKIDLLLDGGEGFELVDYKTDEVEEAEVEGRADAYQAQVEAYRGAVVRITGRPVVVAHLVFLSARRIVTL